MSSRELRNVLLDTSNDLALKVELLYPYLEVYVDGNTPTCLYFDIGKVCKIRKVGRRGRKLRVVIVLVLTDVDKWVYTLLHDSWRIGFVKVNCSNYVFVRLVYYHKNKTLQTIKMNTRLIILT